MTLPVLRNSKEVQSFDSIVAVKWRLQARQFEVQIPSKKVFVFSPKCASLLWVPPSLLFSG